MKTPSFGPQWQTSFEDAKKLAARQAGSEKERYNQLAHALPTAARTRHTDPRLVDQKMDKTGVRNQLRTTPGLPSSPAERWN